MRAAFRTDSREVGDLLFSASRFDKSRPRFGVKIFELGDRDRIFGIGTTTQRERNSLCTFLGYNPVALYPD